jgi:pyruvate/2-oxoglutarate dehydrogenase complex dihydrolipoamide dehydrogenase (E3) component
MKHQRYDCAVIGGGAAGMTAALELSKKGRSVVLIERDAMLGGILNQCIHNGFGLHWFDEELTGPEYAERFAEEVLADGNIKVFLSMCVTEIRQSGSVGRTPDDDGNAAEGAGKQVIVSSARSGVLVFDVDAVVLAMGCRERNRGNIGIPGTRPAGVFTAGLAQRLVNVEGYVPGTRCVIVGSGDIGLIMARRMTWVGVKVEAVVEIQPYPAGLTRNIVQCLNDFDIPLYLSHEVTEIRGRDRVEGVHIAPVDGSSEGFDLSCDTILLSVGLVPDTEIIRSAGMEIRPETNGPGVDQDLMASMEGVFACGNVLHVHDLVDWVSEEAVRCAEGADAWLSRRNGDGELAGRALSGDTVHTVPVTAGANVRYVLPQNYRADVPRRFSMRSMVVSNKAVLELRRGKTVLQRKKLRHIQPSEMIHIDVDPESWSGSGSEIGSSAVFEFHISTEEEVNG